MAVLLETGAELMVHVELVLGGQLPRERHHARERDCTCMAKGAQRAKGGDIGSCGGGTLERLA